MAEQQSWWWWWRHLPELAPQQCSRGQRSCLPLRLRCSSLEAGRCLREKNLISWFIKSNSVSKTYVCFTQSPSSYLLPASPLLLSASFLLMGVFSRLVLGPLTVLALSPPDMVLVLCLRKGNRRKHELEIVWYNMYSVKVLFVYSIRYSKEVTSFGGS